MADTEYEKLQEALRKPPTEEARRNAAEAMRRYLASREDARKSLGARSRRKGSTPTLVTLGLNKPYPTSIRLEDIPDQIEKNPEFYKLIEKVVAEK